MILLCITYCIYRAKPGIDDLSIYLRCLPNHYHFNSIEYYSAILSYVTYKRIWLFLAPAVSVYIYALYV